MKYQWKSGSRFKSDPQVAGEVCEKLASESRLTAKELVEVSRAEDAPLHDEFNWNDAEAAELYREDQGRLIIRSLVVSRENIEEPVREFHLVLVENQKRYESIEVIVKEENLKCQMLTNALNEFYAFRRKYKTLTEFAELFNAFEKVEQVSLVVIDGLKNAMVGNQ